MKTERDRCVNRAEDFTTAPDQLMFEPPRLAAQWLTAVIDGRKCAITLDEYEAIRHGSDAERAEALSVAIERRRSR